MKIFSRFLTLFHQRYNLIPRRVFLLDAVGASITCSILAGILPPFSELFQVDRRMFFILSAYALILFGYSTAIFVLKPTNWVPYLRIIASANAVYCLITFGIIYFFNPTISTLGVVYFVGEAIIILSIAYFEWSFAAVNKTKPFQ